jgi:repressor LexA
LLEETIARLQKVILDSGLTYEELEKISGVPKSAIHRYASGATEKIPIDRIEKIALGLNIDPAKIVGWINETAPPPTPPPPTMDLAEIGKKIKQARERNAMTLQDVASAIGLARSTIQRYETGKIAAPKLPVIEAIAHCLQVSPAWLTGKIDTPTTQSLPPPPTIEDMAIAVTSWLPVPVVGSVRAGVGGIAVEEIERYEPIPLDWIRAGVENYFLLRVEGDSMSPRILEGDLVLVKKQTYVDSGSLAIVTVDSEEGVIKRVDHGNEWIRLVSTNPAYEPRIFSGSEVSRVSVLGKVTKLIRSEV